MSKRIPVVGFDPSLRNWGIVRASYLPGSEQELILHELQVTSPILPKGKQVRKNSEDLEAAKQLSAAAIEAAKGAKAVFVEVPVGSQSARSMASYGICVGVLGALRATGIPFFEVSPAEVKKASVGKLTASKKEMVQWALDNHPEADWPTHKEQGKTLITVGTAEHMADAAAAIYAGIASNSFQQLLPFILQDDR